jgi:hypothetical protein
MERLYSYFNKTRELKKEGPQNISYYRKVQLFVKGLEKGIMSIKN